MDHRRIISRQRALQVAGGGITCLLFPELGGLTNVETAFATTSALTP